MNNNIYLDNAATTPVDPQVLKAMMPYFCEEYGNASSLHQMGTEAMAAVDASRAEIADFLGCSPEEVYFTSGATESDNMAVLGLVGAFQRQFPGKKWHIIASQIEHDAILETFKRLAEEGVETTYLPVNSRGLVEVNRLKKAIRPNTILVSIMYANNEIGAIQPIAEIGELIKEINKKSKGGRFSRIYFHTDAVQAAGYLNCDVKKLGVDLLSLSGHKIYGPKGVGALYLKKGTPFEPLFFGGHQQNDIRVGTYNVPGIVGLGKAVELAGTKTQKHKNTKTQELRDYLVKEVKRKITGVLVNGDLRRRLPNNASFIFKGAEGESIVLMLSQKGIATSTGSACSSGSLEPSHVLLAIGIKPELAHGSLRVTLGRFTTKKDINILLRELPPIIEKLRKMSPLK
ncbi:MAG: cysteine desulfurase family protein [Patescibacteria group bacterium]